MASEFTADDEERLVKQLKARFSDHTSQDANFALDNACMRRYLRARQWDLDEAENQLRSTLTWRQEHNVADITTNHLDLLCHENETGKMYVRGFDKQGRVILLMKPRFENTRDHEGNVMHLIFTMEKAVACCRSPMEKITILIDYSGYSIFNAPAMGTSTEILKILQTHYPERLGQALMFNPPRIFSIFWNVVYPFIDSVTRDKILFVRNVDAIIELVDESELEISYGGRLNDDFNSSVYMRLNFNQPFV